MDLLHLLRMLTTTPGPSGLETDVATLLAEIWQPWADEISRDALGNLFGLKYGSGPEPRPRLLITAHMDEIALMVTRIEPFNGYGFLRVTNVGGVDRRQLAGQRVMVHGRRNLPGVLGALPEGMWPKERRGKVAGYDDLVVDAGCSADFLRQHVRIGDFVTFRQPLLELGNGRVAGKALDNRAILAALTLALEALQNRRHTWDVVLAATVQEEFQLAGATTATWYHNPDAALILDVSFATQPGVSDPSASDPGSGPLLDIGIEVHPALLARLQETAKQLEIPVSLLPHARGSYTEAEAVQRTRLGVPAAILSLPLRYMHTAVEMVDLQDIRRTARLIAGFVAGLDDTFLPSLPKALIGEPAGKSADNPARNEEAA
jgi:endoglucanase